MSKKRTNTPSPTLTASDQKDLGILPSPPNTPQATLEKFAPFILFALAFLLYVLTFGHGFVLDDPMSVELNQYVQKGISGIPDILTSNYRAGVEGANSSGQVYRPLSLIMFAIEHDLAPNSTFLLHFINVLLYAFSAVAVWLLYRALLPNASYLLPFAAAVLFVAHPIHTEVVANIKSRDEILALLFIALSLWACVKYLQQNTIVWLLAMIGSYFLALLSKESAITMIPVFALIAYFVGKRNIVQSATQLLWATIPAALFLGMRYYAITHSTGIDEVSKMDNPIVEAGSILIQWATGFLVLGKYLLMLFVPYQLIYDYSYNAMPLTNFGDFRVLLSILVYIALAIYAFWQLPKRNIVALCILALFCSLSIYSQLILVIGTLFGERLAYLPSLWFCLGIVYVLFSLLNSTQANTQTNNGRQIAMGIVLAISALFGIKTVIRAAEWKNNLSLFSADAPKSPNSVRLNDNLSTELHRQYINPNSTLSPTQKEQLLSDMIKYSKQSLTVAPSPVAYVNIGNAYFAQRKFTDAETNYLKSLEIMPNFGVAKGNLASVYREWGREEGEKNQNVQKAIELLQKSLLYDDQNPTAYNMLGAANGMLQNHAVAIEMFEKSLTLNPNDQTVIKNLIIAYRNTGNTQKAQEYEQKLK